MSTPSGERDIYYFGIIVLYYSDILVLYYSGIIVLYYFGIIVLLYSGTIAFSAMADLATLPKVLIGSI